MATNTPAPLSVSEREAARLIGVSARTLFNWRKEGIAPAHLKIGGRVLYSVEGLHAFLNPSRKGA